LKVAVTVHLSTWDLDRELMNTKYKSKLWATALALDTGCLVEDRTRGRPERVRRRIACTKLRLKPESIVGRA